MAIGDSYNVFLGTGTVNRQPASGVVETVDAINKSSQTDGVFQYDGTNTISFLATSIKTGEDHTNNAVSAQPIYNMGVKSSNGVYLRKGGTTDRIGVGGVQVDA